MCVERHPGFLCLVFPCHVTAVVAGRHIRVSERLEVKQSIIKQLLLKLLALSSKPLDLQPLIPILSKPQGHTQTQQQTNFTSLAR